MQRVSFKHLTMVIISKGTLNRFISEFPVAGEALLRWYGLTKEADWNDLLALKRTFSTADYVGNGLFVFNIGGNKFRLICRIIFGARTVFIKWIGPHSDYNKVKLSDL